MAGRALALLAFAASAGVSDAAYYYGRYGAAGVAGRGAHDDRRAHASGVYGRRLLQDEAEPPLAAAARARARVRRRRRRRDRVRHHPRRRHLPPGVLHPASALEDLPRLREAMDSPERTDTFFAPTNEAIDALLQWGGFVEKAKVRERAEEETPRNRPRRNALRGRSPVAIEFARPSTLDDNSYARLSRRNHHPFPPSPRRVSTRCSVTFPKGAHHRLPRIPNVTYTAADLAAKAPTTPRIGTSTRRSAASWNPPRWSIPRPRNRRRTALVDENLGDVFLKGIGSEAKVVTPNIPACGSVVHAVDTVLLPLDGDAQLDEFQKRRVAEIRARSRAIIEKRAAEAAEREDQDDEYDQYDDVAAAPEMAPEMAPAAAPAAA